METNSDKQKKSPFMERFVKPVLAVLVTIVILYFLFGVPAYLLLKQIFA